MNQVVALAINPVLVLGAVLMLGLSAFLWAEVLAALLPRRHRVIASAIPDCKVAILVPAHNEELGLRETLATLRSQLRDADRLVVVADNCCDGTAAIAREMGAIVLERQDEVRVGKGFALDYGLQFLAAEPPDVVIFVDADCQVQAGAIAQLTQQVLDTGRPAQATYLMEKPPEPSAKDSVSGFAFKVKNLVRPLGLARFRLPCLLTGTGMAFPWAAIRSVEVASADIVEDMKLSLDLTIAGMPPLFCPEALVLGSLPQQGQAAQSQRTRWEHGHLQSISRYVPKLIGVAIEKQRLAAIPLALELSVPPLSLLVMMGLAFSIITALWGALSGLWLPALLAAIAGSLLAISILSAWAKFGRDVLPLKELLSIPFYILWKVPLYFRFLVRPQKAWVRTARDGESVEN